MKLLIFISLFGGLLLASCGSSSSQKNASTQEVNPADTIYLGDLREKFEGDSIFFKVVAPDLMLMDYQYFWAATESEAVEKGLTKEYYKRVKKEISETNEAIKKGVMKGADVKRIPDFQEGQKEINRFKEKLIIAMIDKKKGDVKYDFSFFLHQCLVKENHNFI